jgi:mRNA deadenylase 3'-5' endonuclease subunit Ccr4
VIEFLTSGRVPADHKDFKSLAYKSCLQKISGCDKPNEFTHSFKLASAYSEDIMPFTNYTYVLFFKFTCVYYLPFLIWIIMLSGLSLFRLWPCIVYLWKYNSKYNNFNASIISVCRFDFKGIIDYIFYSKQSMTPLGLLGPLAPEWLRENKVVGCPHPHVPSGKSTYS